MQDNNSEINKPIPQGQSALPDEDTKPIEENLVKSEITEKENIKQAKEKRVEREHHVEKKRHTGRKILLSSILFIILGFSSYLIYHHENHFTKIIINSNPEHALIYMDGKKIGVSPLKMALPVGVHNFVFHKKGFSKYSQKITITKDQRAIAESAKSIVK